MPWDRATVRDTLLAAGLYAEERAIDHGIQFALDDGTRVNVYSTGKILVQGKATPTKAQVQQLLTADNADSATASVTRAAAGKLDKRSVEAVTMYTDGACIGNPGPGGWGVVLAHGAAEQELSGGYRLTTNNRMELTAAIRGLEALSARSDVLLHSDSLYVVKGMREGWAVRWRANGWRRTKTSRAVNPDLWGRLLDLCDEHTVTFQWVRGHAGDDGNERADRLANAAARQSDLPPDEEYERGSDGTVTST